MLAHEELALERHRQHAVPFLLGDVEDVLVVGDRDIVDQNVDAAEASDHGLDQRRDVAALGDVGREQLGLAAGLPDRGRDPLAARLVQVDDRNLGALGGEQPGDLLADIAAGAGDDRDLILELHRLSPFVPARVSLHSPRQRGNKCRPRGIAANMLGRNAQNMDFVMTAPLKTVESRPTLPA